MIAVPQGMMGPADSSRTHHALGFLPAKLFDTVRRRFLSLHQRSKARFVRRTE